MNEPSNNDDTQNDYAAFIAIDWADRQHVFSLQVAGQSTKETGTLEQKPEVIGPWVARLRERFGGRPVAIAVEQSRGALIHALLTYDFIVIYPLHPTTVAKFREAFKSSGAKSDPLDTDQILQILTKHRELLKALNPDTEQTRLLARLVEDRRKAVNLRTSHVQALTAALKEYFPQAIELVNGEKVLGLATTANPLTTDSAIVESGSRLSQMHAQIIQTLNPLIVDYERRIEKVFHDHPEANLFCKLPGAGPALAPRLLSFFGTDRSRYEGAGNVQSFCGIAPVTKSSGKTRVVYFRHACPKFDRQTFHEFARLSVAKCQWARNYVDYYTAKGKKFHTIIRALAFKWIRILFRCWKNRTPYEETKYIASLKKRGSIFATLHLEQKS